MPRFRSRPRFANIRTYRTYRVARNKRLLTCPLRTDMVTISFFSHAFSYTTLIGSPPLLPVFSQIVMLLLAIKSAREGGEQAKSHKTVNILILLQSLETIFGSPQIQVINLISLSNSLKFLTLFVILKTRASLRVPCKAAAVINYRGRLQKRWKRDSTELDCFSKMTTLKLKISFKSF